MIIVNPPFEFEWDKGNDIKNFLKHGVSNEEIEQIFWDENKKLFEDEIHSDEEDRYILLGKTFDEKLLFVVFTLRGRKIRVISARSLNKREISLYK